jgi:hypothetical protein
MPLLGSPWLRREHSVRVFDLEINGGWKLRFVRFPVFPTPNLDFARFLGPEVPRTLGKGTPHAKLEKIQELPRGGFKPKE